MCTPISIYKGCCSNIVLLKNLPSFLSKADILSRINGYQGLVSISFLGGTTAKMTFEDLDYGMTSFYRNPKYFLRLPPPYLHTFYIYIFFNLYLHHSFAFYGPCILRWACHRRLHMHSWNWRHGWNGRWQWQLKWFWFERDIFKMIKNDCFTCDMLNCNSSSKLYFYTITKNFNKYSNEMNIYLILWYILENDA